MAADVIAIRAKSIFDFMFPFRVARAAANEKRRAILTLHNRHGNAQEERFQTRPMGRAFKRCLPLKFPVLLWTAAEATQIGCCVFSGRYFLADADD